MPKLREVAFAARLGKRARGLAANAGASAARCVKRLDGCGLGRFDHELDFLDSILVSVCAHWMLDNGG